MRLAYPLAAVAALALGFLPATALGGKDKDRDNKAAIPESIEIQDARGQVTVTGVGILIGRVERGSLVFQDRSPGDAWSPHVNGVPYGKTVSARGRDLSFRVFGGRYRIVVKGEGIAISGRGSGSVVVKAKGDGQGGAGAVQVGDDEPITLSGTGEKMIEFGGTGDSGSSDELGHE